MREGCTHAYHIFAVLSERRDELVRYMTEKGVGVQIHYPVPPHLSPCYDYMSYHPGDFPIAEAYASQEMSLPIYVGLKDEEASYVIDCLNSFR